MYSGYELKNAGIVRGGGGWVTFMQWRGGGVGNVHAMESQYFFFNLQGIF